MKQSISPISFGCEPLGGTDWGNIDLKEIKNAIHIALDLGINFFDTAGVYGLGLSEKRLSKILGNRRHHVIIATKGGLTWKNYKTRRSKIIKDSSPIVIRKDAESSLKRLRLETLPIFFVHWPDVNTPIEDTFIELMKLKKEGKINSIGCSNFSVEQLNRACLVSQVEFIQMPINILSGPIDKKISKICEINNIRIIGYNILVYGLLTGKFNIDSTFSKKDRRSRLPLFKGSNFIDILKSVEKLKLKAIKEKKSLTNYVINWALTQKNISSVILGIKNSRQLLENYSIISNKL